MSNKKGVLGLTFKMNAAGWLTIGLAAVVGLGVFVYSYTMKDRQGAKVDATVANKTDNLNNRTQGNLNSTPDYQAQIKQQNQLGAQQASKTGQSFVATPLLAGDKKASQTSLLANPEPVKEVEKPKEPEQKTPEPEKKEAPKPQTYPVNVVAPKNVSDAWTALTDQMREMRRETPSVNMYHPTVVEYKDYNNGNGSQGTAGSVPVSATAVAANTNPLAKDLRVGQLIYGMTLIRTSSALPNGKFLGEIVQGPLNGARVLGSFQRVPNENLMAVKIDTISPTVGDPINVEAYVLDPSTTLPAMASDVDRHILERAGAFMSASFLAAISGYGQALARTGQSIVTSTTGSVVTNPTLTTSQLWQIAAGKAAQDLQKPAQVLDNLIVQPNTIYINENQPFVMMVVSVK